MGLRTPTLKDRLRKYPGQQNGEVNRDVIGKEGNYSVSLEKFSAWRKGFLKEVKLDLCFFVLLNLKIEHLDDWQEFGAEKICTENQVNNSGETINHSIFKFDYIKINVKTNPQISGSYL